MTSSVASYVQELLYEQDCVVIPDFGGFIANFLSAGYQSATGVYVPPKKRIAFNEVLKFDDGLLSSYISHRQEINRTEALSLIATFVKEIKDTLQSDQKFVFEHLGTFRLNAEGKLLFEPATDTNYYAEGYGLANLFLAKNKAGQPIAATEERQEPVIIPLEVPEAVPPQPYDEAVTPIIAEEHDEIIDVFPDYTEPESKEIHFPVKSFPWWLAACVAVLCMVGFTVYFYRTNQRQEASLGMLNPVYSLLEKTPFMEAKRHGVSLGIAANPAKYADSALKNLLIHTSHPYFENPVVLGDAQVSTFEKYSKNDTLQLNESKLGQNSETNPTHTLKQPEARYYVIAGAFESRHNANNLKRLLALNGYESVKILSPSRGEYLIKVAAAGFKSFSKAAQETERVSEITGEDAWILRNRN
ncbi:MAG: SPOR domain-containing protein [Spirosomataceae bacterium]